MTTPAEYSTKPCSVPGCPGTMVLTMRATASSQVRPRPMRPDAELFPSTALPRTNRAVFSQGVASVPVMTGSTPLFGGGLP